MKTETLELTQLHLDVLNEIRSQTPYHYHPYAWSKREQAAITQLVAAGKILKTIERYQVNGGYRSRVTLAIKK